MRKIERDLIRKKAEKIFPDIVYRCRDNSTPTISSVAIELGISQHAVSLWYADWKYNQLKQ